ncbi:D-alanyl-D-alanine carboxypeptidase [Streptomyces sp. HPF1205]|uniref:D-alanyl-D-alanine carboxypeptidase n=1 Tax=Streptomyces sp. HPF1205 TaxID=2873262 RepID=UPI001CEDC17A|nr:D-alanyl-D-alanine carboxypeptidase [Streptomyces sp. HPF1205]
MADGVSTDAASDPVPDAPERTPVAERGARTAGGPPGEIAGAGSGQPAAPEDATPHGTIADEGEGRPRKGGATKDGDENEDGTREGAAGGKAQANGAAGGKGASDGKGAAKDVAASAAAGADRETGADREAGGDREAGADPEAGADSKGAAKDTAAGAEDRINAEGRTDGGHGADGTDGADGAVAGPASASTSASTRVLKPLVSDLPVRPQGASGGGAAGPRAQVAFGTPGTPVRARTPSQAPSGAAPAPLPPAAPPGPVPPVKPADAAGGGAIGPEGTLDLPMPPEPTSGQEPRDPLKLLAELTNTPPPPQTLLRSIMRRFKIWTPLVALLAVAFVVVQALRPLPSPGLKLTAAPTYTFAGTPLPASLPWPSEGQSVAEVEGLGSLGVRGAQTPVPIASVTKVMTAYVILRDHPLAGKENGPTITVDATAARESASTDESTAHVQAGQRFTERQMLQLLLIPSGNNIARLLARWDAGTQEAFVAKMRAEAAALGMTHTTYTGASGFEETTVSTAVDQLKLAREVMKNDVFRSVVALPNINIPGVGVIYNNNNDLVHLGVVGVKTGSSTPAGGALMWAAHRTINGKQQLILGVVLQQRGGRTTPSAMLDLALANSQKMIDAIQGGLTQATIVKKGQVVGYVDDGLGGRTPVAAAKDLVAIGWPGMKTTLSLTAGSAGVPHSAASGTQVGTVAFGSGSAKTSVPVVLQGDLHQPSFGKKLTRLG